MRGVSKGALGLLAVSVVAVGLLGYVWRFHSGKASGMPPDLKELLNEAVGLKSACVKLNVLLPDGTEARSAFVHADQFRDQSTELWQWYQPFLDFNPGTYDLRAVGGPYGMYASNETQVTIPRGRPAQLVTLRLEDSPGVYGRVTISAHEGEVKTPPLVAIVRVHGSMASTLSRMADCVETAQVEPFDAGYAFRKLDPGCYLVGVVWSGSVVAAKRVTIGRRMVRRDLSIAEMDANNSVVFRVTGPDGKLVSHVRFLTESILPNGDTRLDGRYRTLDDGSYRVFNPPVAKGHPVRHAFRTFDVITKAYGREAVQIRAGRTTEVTVRFAKAGSLDLHIAKFAEMIGAQLTVDLEFMKKRHQLGNKSSVLGGRERTVRRDGVVKFANLLPGSYRLSVAYDVPVGVGTTSKLPIAELHFDLSSGASDRTVKLPRLYDLTVVGAPAGAPLSLSSTHYHWLERLAAASSDGRVVFHALPAGHYCLHDARPKPGMMQVTVPGFVVHYRPHH